MKQLHIPTKINKIKLPSFYEPFSNLSTKSQFQYKNSERVDNLGSVIKQNLISSYMVYIKYSWVYHQNEKRVVKESNFKSIHHYRYYTK